MDRCTAISMALGVLLSPFVLLASKRIGIAAQSDVESVKAALDSFHSARGSLDVKKMEALWAHAPHVMLINPRDKSVALGSDAVRKKRLSPFGPI